MAFNQKVLSFCFSVIIILANCTEIAHAQGVVSLTKLKQAISLDGKIDEEAWQSVPVLPVVMFEPVFKGSMTEKTEVKVAYDSRNLYVAGKLFHKNTDDIRANSLYRDRYSQDDTFAIIVDPFNDDENGRWFFTNPVGVRFDMAVSNDAESTDGNAVNRSWNTWWDVETDQNEEGWSVEMRIPFSSLGFQVADDEAVVGIIVYRFLAKANERHIYPAIPPNWNNAKAKPSQAQDVLLAGIQNEKPLYVTPYVLGGIDRQMQQAQADLGGEYFASRNHMQEPGFDLKYNVTSNLTLDATFNTDFAQVEADDQQVNLSRVPLFVPEKRQFFQERSSLFNFSLGGDSRLFFSRRIGLDSSGNPIRIWGGGRLTGRIASWDIGVINMQTDQSYSLPSENFGVLRLRRKVINNRSHLGVIGTSRLGSDGSYNLAYGVDGAVNIAGNEYLTARVAQTFYDNLAGRQHKVRDNSFIRIDWTRRVNRGLFYQAAYTRSGSYFNPGIGFMTRHNVTHWQNQLSYADLLDETSAIRRWDANVKSDVYIRNTDGSVESMFVRNFYGIEFKSGASVRAGIKHWYEDLREEMSFVPKTSVPAGAYSFYSTFLRYEMASSRRLRTSIRLETGSFYDGWNHRFKFSPAWNASAYLEMSGEYELNRLLFPSRGQSFDVHLMRLRNRVALNRRLSAEAFVQFSNVSELVAANLRIRYNYGEGNDLWLVYNEQLNTNLSPLDPTYARLPLSQARSALVKLTYTFKL